MKPFLYSFLSMLPLFGWGQVNIDSLRNALSLREQPIEVQLDQLDALSDAFKRISLDSAEHYSRKMLALSDEKNFAKQHAEALHNLGSIYSQKGKYPQSLEFYEKSLEIRRGLNEEGDIARSLNNMGIIFHKQDQYAKAMDYYQQSLPIFRQAGDKAGAANVLKNMGLFHFHTGNDSLAIAFFDQSMEVNEEIGNSQGVASLMNNMANVYFKNNQYEQAIHHYSVSLEKMTALGSKKGIADALNNLGAVYYRQGNYAKAIEYFTKSLQIMEALGHELGVANALANIGAIYKERYQRDKALEYYRRAKEVYEETSYLYGQASVLHNMGLTHMETSSSDEALKEFQQSLDISKQIGQDFLVALNLGSIGEYHHRKGQVEQAIGFYERSLSMNEALQDQNGVVESLNSLGAISLEMEDFTQARKHGDKALRMATDIGNLRQIRNAAYNLYRANKSLGNMSKSLESFEIYVNSKDSLESEKNRREILRQEFQYQYEKQALSDSLDYVQKQAASEMAFQHKLNNRNFLLSGALVLILLGIFGFWVFRNQQREIARKREFDLLKERERKEQLAELDELKSRFFANISHEFRTPLTIIKGMSGRVKAEPQMWLPQGMAMIERNSQQLLGLVNQMLDLAKLDAGHFQLNLIQGDVVPHITYLTESFRSHASIKGVTLHLLVEDEEIVMDHDPECLTQVVSNLLSNAIKFTPENGHVYLSLWAEQETCLLKVKDTGMGMEKEHLPYIFDRFYQAKMPLEFQQKGTGIGLALVGELVKAMEGEIEVKSQVGKGSEFLLRLPIRKNAVIASQAPPSINFTDEGEKNHEEEWSQAVAEEGKDLPLLLIIEDSQDVVIYLKAALSTQYQIQVAKDGVEGIKMALSMVPDIIICDVMMPRKGGYEVCDVLKKDIRTSHVPIILLTAKADLDSRLLGLETGADAYLSKPFEEKELLVRLENLLGLRKKLREKYSQSASDLAQSIVPAKESINSLEEKFLRDLGNILNDHLDDHELDVSALCKMLGLSRAQLHRKLKAITGKSTTQFVREFRLEKAKSLLEDKGIPISTVAYLTGFANPNYFSRAFSEKYGLSPREFRGA